MSSRPAGSHILDHHHQYLLYWCILLLQLINITCVPLPHIYIDIIIVIISFHSIIPSLVLTALSFSPVVPHPHGFLCQSPWTTSCIILPVPEEVTRVCRGIFGSWGVCHPQLSNLPGAMDGVMFLRLCFKFGDFICLSVQEEMQFVRYILGAILPLCWHLPATCSSPLCDCSSFVVLHIFLSSMCLSI